MEEQPKKVVKIIIPSKKKKLKKQIYRKLTDVQKEYSEKLQVEEKQEENKIINKAILVTEKLYNFIQKSKWSTWDFLLEEIINKINLEFDNSLIYKYKIANKMCLHIIEKYYNNSNKKEILTILKERLDFNFETFDFQNEFKGNKIINDFLFTYVSIKR